jgi:hypothetical protein
MVKDLNVLDKNEMDPTKGNRTKEKAKAKPKRRQCQCLFLYVV